MTQDVWTNAAQASLTAAVSTTPAAGTSETWSIGSIQNFPTLVSGQQFRCAVAPTSGDSNPEIVIVTAWTSTTATVSRGAEGSPIKTHASGDIITLITSAAELSALQVVVPTIVCSLTSTFSGYHQAPMVVVQGTFVAPAATFKLRAQVSGYAGGGAYSGVGLSLVVGIPGTANATGGIIGEEVSEVGTGHNPVHGTALYPVSGTAGTYGCMVNLGALMGEFATGSLVRDVVYTGATPGTTYTAQIITGSISGFDGCDSPNITDSLGGTAVTPAYDPTTGAQSTSTSGAIDIWTPDAQAQTILRFQVGRRAQAQYEGVQPRILYRGSLPITAPTFQYPSCVIDKNGIMAVWDALATTVTIVDTKANNHTGAVLATSPALGGNIQNVVSMPDGSGFWAVWSTTGRTDTATVTSGSATVSDASITAADQGKMVTGTGIPTGTTPTYVGTVTAGVSFLLSSSPTSQVNVNATQAGTSVVIGNSAMQKISPSTAAVIATIGLGGNWGTMRLAIDPTSALGYLYTSAYPGIVTYTLSSGASVTGPAISNVNCLAVSPDGTKLLLGDGSSPTWGLRSLALPGAPSAPTNTATLTGAARRGTAWVQYLYSIIISADSKMFFASGYSGVWSYGWISDMAIFDSMSAGGGTESYLIVVTPDDGIYIVASGGSGTDSITNTALPHARIFGWPGSTFTCDPTGSLSNGSYFAEVLL